MLPPASTLAGPDFTIERSAVPGPTPVCALLELFEGSGSGVSLVRSERVGDAAAGIDTRRARFHDRKIGCPRTDARLRAARVVRGIRVGRVARQIGTCR